MTPITNLQFWVSILSPFLVLAGWFFVYGNSNRIAKRSEAYSIVTKTVDKVLALDTRCANFWLATEQKENPQKWVAGTLSEIHGIRALLEMLEAHHSFNSKSELLIKLRMSSTLDAEKIEKLSMAELRTKKQEQSLALSSSLKSLYEYYRTLNN